MVENSRSNRRQRRQLLEAAMRNVIILSQTILAASLVLSGSALAQALPNYEIRPVYGSTAPLAGTANGTFIPFGEGWNAWKIDRINNRVSLCSVSLVVPLLPPPPGPIMPGSTSSSASTLITPTMPIGNPKLVANPVCTKDADFSGNAMTSAFASAGPSTYAPFANRSAFWSVDLTTGAVTFCLSGSGCVALTDR
jgi:hypothetical protein